MMRVASGSRSRSAPSSPVIYARTLCTNRGLAEQVTRETRLSPQVGFLKKVKGLADLERNAIGAALHTGQRRAVPLLLIAAGVLLAQTPPVFGIPLAAYVSVGLLLVGVDHDVVELMPVSHVVQSLAEALANHLLRIRRPVAQAAFQFGHGRR